jgi:hypothetical protein
MQEITLDKLDGYHDEVDGLVIDIQSTKYDGFWSNPIQGSWSDFLDARIKECIALKKSPSMTINCPMHVLVGNTSTTYALTITVSDKPVEEPKPAPAPAPVPSRQAPTLSASEAFRQRLRERR